MIPECDWLFKEIFICQVTASGRKTRAYKPRVLVAHNVFMVPIGPM